MYGLSGHGQLGRAAVGILAALALGCGNGEEPAGPQPKPDPVAVTPKDKQPPDVVPKQQIEEPPPKPTIPDVKLSETHLATCKVKVGDAMPAVELPTAGGEPKKLSDLLGKKLTVVLFWTQGNPYAEAAVEDLARDALEPFGDQGLSVVGIHRGPLTDDVKAVIESAQPPYPQLIDAEGAAFDQVATSKLPRVYLLDANGKILWFDIEYGTATRRDLEQAIRAALDLPAAD